VTASTPDGRGTHHAGHGAHDAGDGTQDAGDGTQDLGHGTLGVGDGVIRAFGGAIWRQRAGGIEVLLVHRPAYDDWSLPKGKLDPGEGPIECALREVEEETGTTCQVGAELLTVRYDEQEKRSGRTLTKEVTFYEMTPLLERERPPDDEVDAMKWLPLAEARRSCSYPTDLEVLERLEALLAVRCVTEGSSGGVSSPDI
jgi:8-oxo-dGTP pyrophosphatase MutT (NUDIX family)